MAQLFGEEKRLLPHEDNLLAIDGVAGAYPNAIFALDAEKLPDFMNRVSTMNSNADLVKLTERYGVRRTDPRFWPTSDAIHAAWRRVAPAKRPSSITADWIICNGKVGPRPATCNT